MGLVQTPTFRVYYKIAISHFPPLKKCLFFVIWGIFYTFPVFLPFSARVVALSHSTPYFPSRFPSFRSLLSPILSFQTLFPQFRYAFSDVSRKVTFRPVENSTPASHLRAQNHRQFAKTAVEALFKLYTHAIRTLHRSTTQVYTMIQTSPSSSESTSGLFLHLYKGWPQVACSFHVKVAYINL